MRLVKILQDLAVVLHGIHGPQLDCVAFKLDRDPHFATGIGATDILGTALHTPHRGRGPETGNELPGGGTECKPMTPLVKRGSLHHTGLPPGVGVCGGGLCGGKRTPCMGQTQAVDAYLRPRDAYLHHFDAYPRPKMAKRRRHPHAMSLPLSEANLCVKIDFGQRYGSEHAA